MSLFHRQLWKQKPQAWGPLSAVQYALRHHLEQKGIGWEDVALALPMWNPGNQYDYANGISFDSTIPYSMGRLYFNGSVALNLGNLDCFDGLTEFTALSNCYNQDLWADRAVFGQWSSPYDQRQILLHMDTGDGADGYSGTISTKIGEHANDRTTANAIQDVWQSVGLSYDGSLLNTYVDGSLSLSDSASGTINKSSNPFYVGWWGNTEGFYWLGWIDYFLFFNTKIHDNTISYISDNPYQIWQPVPQTRYFFVDSGSGTTDNLTNADLTCGTPTLDTPTISQTHALNGTDLTAGIPSVETPTIGQIHSLAGQDITLGTPVLDTPTLAEGTDNLVVFDLTAGTPTLEAPIIGQVHVLDVVDLTCGTPTIDAPTLVEGSAVLSAIDITAGIPTIVSPIIGQVHILTASGATARAPTIEIPRLNYVVSTTPIGRTYTISAETRIYTISAETRIYTI